MSYKGLPEIPIMDVLDFKDSMAVDWELALVKCPVCGDTNTHVSGVSNDGGDDYDKWRGRGGVAAVSFYCESSHTFDLVFGFHKGNTFTFAVRGEDMPPSQEEFDPDQP